MEKSTNITENNSDANSLPVFSKKQSDDWCKNLGHSLIKSVSRQMTMPDGNLFEDVWDLESDSGKTSYLPIRIQSDENGNYYEPSDKKNTDQQTKTICQSESCQSKSAKQNKSTVQKKSVVKSAKLKPTVKQIEKKNKISNHEDDEDYHDEYEDYYDDYTVD